MNSNNRLVRGSSSSKKIKYTYKYRQYSRSCMYVYFTHHAWVKKNYFFLLYQKCTTIVQYMRDIFKKMFKTKQNTYQQQQKIVQMIIYLNNIKQSQDLPQRVINISNLIFFEVCIICLKEIIKREKCVHKTIVFKRCSEWTVGNNFQRLPHKKPFLELETDDDTNPGFLLSPNNFVFLGCMMFHLVISISIALYDIKSLILSLICIVS